MPSASIYRYISLLTGAETSLVATVFATASSSRSQVSLRGIVGIVPIEVRPLTRPDELETREAEALASVHGHTSIDLMADAAWARAPVQSVLAASVVVLTYS